MKVNYIGATSGYSGVEVYSRELHEALSDQSFRIRQTEPYDVLKPGFLNHLILNSFRVDKNADINHFTNQDLFSGYYIPQAKNMVVTVHDIFPYLDGNSGPFYSYMAQRYVRNLENHADQIIAISEFTKQQLIENTGIDDNRTTVVYQGVDLQKFRNSENQVEYPKYFLHVGSEIDRKNIPGLIRIFSKIKEEDDDAILVRVGHITDKTAEAIGEQDLELDKDVVYEENICTQRLVELYSNAEKLLFTSYGEGFGRPILESLACGTPVVAYDKRPMSEVLPEEMLVAPEDEDAFAERALQSEDGDAKERSRSIAEKYTWKKTAKQTIDVYRSLK